MGACFRNDMHFDRCSLRISRYGDAMTIPEITAYVMALPVEDVRRLTATDVMGWVLSPPDKCKRRFWYLKNGNTPPYGALSEGSWRPAIDRNQSRMVTDKVDRECLLIVSANLMMFWYKSTPLDESRAALIAHMIHAEEAGSKT